MYNIKVTGIDYCIEEEDIIEEFDYTDEDEIEREINVIKHNLPQEMSFTVECEDDEDLDSIVANKISDKTGWLVNSCEYHIV